MTKGGRETILVLMRVSTAIPPRDVLRSIVTFSVLLFLASGLAGGSAADGVKKYGSYVRDAAEKHGLDENLIHSIIQVESNYNPEAVSVKGASGLMQLIPETAAHYGVFDIFDPQQNIDAGARYLKELISLYRNNLRFVLAAYNAGPDAVKKHNGVPPFPETVGYVRKVLDLYRKRGGPPGGQLYSYRDGQGKVLLTSDKFYLSLKGGASAER